MTSQLPRRPQEATTSEEVLQYYVTRARQLWHEGWRWNQKMEDLDVAFRTEFTDSNGKPHASYYVLAQHHGQGHYRTLMAKETLPIVTITDCHIEQVLEHLKTPYVRGGEILDTAEYRLVEAVFGDDADECTGQFKMNHIDEGLAVLTYLGAGSLAKRAFCLHPLVQADEALAKYFDAISGALNTIAGGTTTLSLAMEFRKAANAWLPGDAMPADSLKPSPLADVNHMLIADKVQGMKDFEKFGTDTPVCKDWQANHYAQWLEVLGASEKYPLLKKMLPTF